MSKRYLGNIDHIYIYDICIMYNIRIFIVYISLYHILFSL